MSTNSISLRGAEQNLEGTIGQTIRRYLQVNDQEGNLIDLGAAGITVTGDVLDSDGVSVESWSVAITDGVAIFTLSAAKTTSIGEQSGLGYAFKVTESGVVNYYIEGSFELFPPGSPHKLRHRSGLADEAQVVVSGGTTLTLTAATPLTLLDEDDFASDSAVKPPSQQSTKAFIEAALAGKIQFATSPPAGPDGADIWIDSNTMDMYARYEDGSSSQWVLVASVSNALVADDALAVAEAAVAKSGDTMTGDLNLDSPTNGISLNIGGGTSDPRAFVNFRDSGDVVLYRLWHDGTTGGGLHVVGEADLDGIAARTYLLSFKDDNGGTIDMRAAAGGVLVPDANADGEALAYDQAGATFKDTAYFTGATYAFTEYKANSAPTDRKRFRVQSTGGNFYIQTITDAGAVANSPLLLEGTGRARFDSATSVLVPAISGANQAAQVTAYNATTGQLQIGGHEVGFTGWRKLTTINGWTGNIYIARNGNLVHMLGFNLDGGSATSQNVVQLSPTVGFVPPHLVTFTGTYDVYSASATTTPDVFRGMVNSVDVKLPQTDDCQFTATWITKNNWPSSLPGTAA